MFKVIDSDRLGFDIEAARNELVRWLIEAEYVTQEEHDSIRESCAGEEAEDAAWLTAGQVADLHASAHYAVMPEVPVGDHQCRETPCRGGAVSFALYELVDYWKAHADGAIDVLQRVAAVKAKLDTIDPTLLRDVRPPDCGPSEPAAPGEQDEMGALAPNQANQLFVNDDALQWLADVARVQREAPAVLESVAEAADIENFSKLARSGRGRRSNELLTAVWQHPNWGFTHKEIAKLVPDLTPGDIRERRERVRKRLASGDARGVKPT